MFNYITYAASKMDEVLERFCDSSAKVQEYVYAERDYVDSYSAANSLRSAVKRTRRSGTVKISVRRGHVYMIKTF